MQSATYSNKSLDRPAANGNVRLALSSTTWVVLVLVSVQLLWKMPKPLFIYIVGVFLLLSALYWAVKRKSPKIGALHIVQLVMLWMIITSSSLLMVYHLDNAGWNWYKLTGYNVAMPENHLDKITLSPREFLQHYAVFSASPHDSTSLVLRQADYEINETVIVPRGVTLTIEPGTIIRFGGGCSLISYSPIFAYGTKDQPIVFTAKRKLLKWGVVGLVKSSQSVFDYVIFEHCRQAFVNDSDFFGGLSAIESEIEITNSLFVNVFGKDAINMQRSKFAIKKNVFKDAFKDGLDIDGGIGEITFNQFINCSDEGIDLSDNFNVRVFNNKILDARGGRISADQNINEILSMNTLGHLNN